MYETVDVDTRYGKMRCFPSDRWLSRSLIELGEWSESELGYIRMFLELIGTKKTNLEIIDAGAYIGDMVIPLSQMCKKIYAFEPQKQVRDVLEYNLEVNKVKNVEVLPYALGDTNKTVYYSSTVSSIPVDPLVSNQMLDSPEGLDSEVEMRTLDSFGLSPDFIKADIEGSEPRMLAGGLQTLTQSRCPLFMECDTVFQHGDIQLADICESLGYSVKKFSFFMWNEENWRGAKTNTFGSTISKMLLALPPTFIE